LSPTHALVNVQVADNSLPGSSYASVISGFQVNAQQNAFQINPAVPNLPVVEPALVNAVWVPSGVFPGSTVTLSGSNLGGAQTKVTISSLPTTILHASATQINLVVPASLQPGPAILRLNNGATSAYPVVVVIAPAPPTISAVQNVSNVNLSATNPAHPGEILSVQVTGLAAPDEDVAPGRVHINVGGDDMPAGIVTEVNAKSYLIQFTLDQAVPTGAQVPLTISIDGKTSLPVYIAIAP